MWSRAKFDGWQGQYRSMLRWRERFNEISGGRGGASMDSQIDFALAFFQTAYHLRDFLHASGAVTKPELDALMTATPALRACRDIANSAKHYEVSRPSMDAEPWIIRAYRPPNDWVLMVKAGEMVEVTDLMSRCVVAWDRFLDDHSLNPHGLSEPAEVLRQAVEAARVVADAYLQDGSRQEAVSEQPAIVRGRRLPTHTRGASK